MRYASKTDTQCSFNIAIQGLRKPIVSYDGQIFLIPLVNKDQGPLNRNVRNEDVYELLRLIPAGKVSTYGDIARAIGHEGASRAIGTILNRNPYPIVVPCHRVVMSNGQLGGYANGVARKRELLMEEGIIVNDNIIVDFRKRRITFQKRSYADNNEISTKKLSEKWKKKEVQEACDPLSMLQKKNGANYKR